MSQFLLEAVISLFTNTGTAARAALVHCVGCFATSGMRSGTEQHYQNAKPGQNLHVCMAICSFAGSTWDRPVHKKARQHDLRLV